MEATLIYNPRAGGARRLPLERALALLDAAGFAPTHLPTGNEDDLDGAIARARGPVVVIGGDGTVRAVAKRLLGRGVPLAVVPLGTANNIARTLGLPARPRAVIEGLARPRAQPFDVGRVSSPWGERVFLEAVGLGLFAEVLEGYAPERGKSVGRALETLREVLRDYAPKRYRLKLDNQEISGSYLAVEALNTRATGPRLQFAPEADPSDGLLDVVCVLVPERVRVAEYAFKLLRGTLETLPTVQVVRARKLEFKWQGQAMHIDADAHPTPEELRRLAGREGQSVTVELLPGALELWLPGPKS